MRKVFPALSVLILIFLLTGCGRAPEVNTSQLQNEAGDYQYPNIPWGLSKPEAESALGITLDTTVTVTDRIQSYLAKDAYTLMALPATVTCEFDNSGLYCINFRVTPDEDDTQAYWELLTAALTAQYGDIDPTLLDSGDDALFKIQSEVYFWDHSDTLHTALSARKLVVSDRSPWIELIIYVIPADR